MSDIDLDICNYNIYEIENFFQLKPHKKYTIADIEYKEYEIRQTLLTSGHINKRFKSDLINFLEKAKQWIIYERFGKTGIQPSSIPYNYKLDIYDLPVSKGYRELSQLKRVENGVFLTQPKKKSVVPFIQYLNNL